MCYNCYNVWYILQATEVEDTIKRIQAHKGVMGVIIVNHEGLVDFLIFPWLHWLNFRIWNLPPLYQPDQYQLSIKFLKIYPYLKVTSLIFNFLILFRYTYQKFVGQCNICALLRPDWSAHWKSKECCTRNGKNFHNFNVTLEL